MSTHVLVSLVTDDLGLGIKPAGPNIGLMLGAVVCFGLASALLMGGGKSMARYGSRSGVLIGVGAFVFLVAVGIVMAVRYSGQAETMAFGGGFVSGVAQILYLVAVVVGGLGGRRMARGY